MARTLAAPAPRRLAGVSAAGADAGALRRSLAGVARLAPALLGLVRARRRARIALLSVAVAVPLLGFVFLWFRQSSFVAVRQVQITGVQGPDAQAVEAALRDAAQGMSTMEVSAARLRAAVAPLRVVSALRAIPSFPHGLRIEVDEQLPAAALDVNGQRTAVAGDGVVLGGALLSAKLPSVSGYTLPGPGRRVRGAQLLQELAVLGAAPPALAAHVEKAFMGARGLTVAMRNGLLVYFGNDLRPHAKWLSLARVLADSGSAGASYVDVRLPSHPAAGFPAGVTPPDAGASSAQPGEVSADSESTIAALAAALPGASGSGNASTSTGAQEAGGGATSTGAAGSAEQQHSPAASPSAQETAQGTGAGAGTTATESAASPSGGPPEG